MKQSYQRPQAKEILFLPADPITLSENSSGGDGFSGGVPFGLRDTFSE